MYGVLCFSKPLNPTIDGVRNAMQSKGYAIPPTVGIPHHKTEGVIKGGMQQHGQQANWEGNN